MDSIKKALALFNSYMTNRTQQVQIGNALSDKCPVNKGNNKITELRTILQRESQNS